MDEGAWLCLNRRVLPSCEPPSADPHARWCGEGGLNTRPYPIRRRVTIHHHSATPSRGQARPSSSAVVSHLGGEERFLRFDCAPTAHRQCYRRAQGSSLRGQRSRPIAQGRWTASRKYPESGWPTGAPQVQSPPSRVHQHAGPRQPGMSPGSVRRQPHQGQSTTAHHG